MANDTIPRRGFLAGAGATGAGVAALAAALPTLPAEAAQVKASDAPVETWLVLTAEEAARFTNETGRQAFAAVFRDIVQIIPGEP